MKQHLFGAATALAMLCAPASSSASKVGTWDVGGKVAIVQVGTSYGVKTAITAEYKAMEALTWRTDIEVLMRELDNVGQTDISIPSNLLYYPLASRELIDPYIGPGLTYTRSFTGSDWLGANLLTGVNFRPARGQKFGIEAKYTVPLLPTPTEGSLEFGLTGSWSVEF